MSLRDFWIHVRTAARSIAPRAIVDSPLLNPASMERALLAADLWLTPRAVADYSEDDFAFLPLSERRQLTRQVQAFRNIAVDVAPREPARQEQREQALPLLRDIIAMLAFDRYNDDEAYRLGKQIEQAIQPQRPRELVDLRFNTGLDNTGDAALWIWAILSDDAADPAVFKEKSAEILSLLESAARAIAPERWPYVRFRTVSEQAEVAEAQAP